MSNHLVPRDAVVLSLHPHNDEGMGVAATELAVLAGADRVEGCLLGNGERTGNVDLVTLGLNFLTQGIDSADRLLQRSGNPQDRRILQPDSETLRTPSVCGQLRVHCVTPAPTRTPSRRVLRPVQVAADRAGASTWTASCGWCRTCRFDPKDIGRSYEAIIRVNSQSGKGGMAYLLKTNHNLVSARSVCRVEFEKVVQNYADETKKEEVKDEDIWRLFKDEYLPVEESGATAAGVVVGDTQGRDARAVGPPEAAEGGRLLRRGWFRHRAQGARARPTAA